MSREIPILETRSRETVFESDVLSRLSRLLPEYITAQRWYRAKARTIKHLQIDDVVQIEKQKSFIFVVRIEYLDGESDLYLLPLTLGNSRDEVQKPDVVARLRYSGEAGSVLRNALADATFRDILLHSIVCNDKFPGQQGEFTASRTTALHRRCGASEPQLESFVSRAEQSNSSLVFGDQYILKVFRKLEPGINPDLEIGRFLTERGFKHTPPVLGELIYQPRHGEAMHAAILQGFVKNKGDAWKYTLESLPGFFERALQNETAPRLDTYHPLQLCDEELPAAARQTIGEFIESARLLGNRTAQMHAALADPAGGPDFAPEKVSAGYAQHLYREMLDQATSTFDLLKDKVNMLSGEAAVAAQKLVAIQLQVEARFSTLRERAISALRIRHHGDYHLGQVLFTGDDFVIIDFEGEPARPLAHRRVKTLAMRDIAGMVRSFSYAGYAGLFGQVPGVPLEPDMHAKVESWAAYWGAWVSAEYLKAYFETANKAAFVGADRDEYRILFDAFVLQKALYEVAYELNNRPDWVQIPLRGILALIS